MPARDTWPNEQLRNKKTASQLLGHNHLTRTRMELLPKKKKPQEKEIFRRRLRPLHSWAAAESYYVTPAVWADTWTSASTAGRIQKGWQRAGPTKGHGSGEIVVLKRRKSGRAVGEMTTQLAARPNRSTKLWLYQDPDKVYLRGGLESKSGPVMKAGL